jgi:glycosyltransferase involved in cell wall biosynthesis
MPLVSIVSPCFNEAEVVALFHQALAAALAPLTHFDFEILLIDDGSTDATLAELNAIAAKDPRVRVASFARNFGQQAALTAGLHFATGDAVITMDCDLQHPPALIPTLLAQWQSGYAVVTATRDDTAGVSVFKKGSSRAFYWLINKLGAVDIPHGAADFGLLSREVVEALKAMPERHVFLRGMIAWLGFKRALVPYVAPARAAGKSKYSFFKMLGLALDAVLSFSTVPIRLATRAGFVITLLGFAYFAWNIVHALRTQNFAPGWASLIAITIILGGSQLLFIGIVGQYMARTFEETKRRPLYVLKQTPRE